MGTYIIREAYEKIQQSERDQEQVKQAQQQIRSDQSRSAEDSQKVKK